MKYKVKVQVPVEKRGLLGLKKTIMETKTIEVDKETYKSLKKEWAKRPYSIEKMIIAFLEGKDFEDVIRNVVSLGGDCDTLTCIAGGIAEAYYGIPEALEIECNRRLPENMRVLLRNFNIVRKRRVGETSAQGMRRSEEGCLA